MHSTLEKLGFTKENWYEVAEDKSRWESEVLEAKLKPARVTGKKKPAFSV